MVCLFYIVGTFLRGTDIFTFAGAQALILFVLVALCLRDHGLAEGREERCDVFPTTPTVPAHTLRPSTQLGKVCVEDVRWGSKVILFPWLLVVLLPFVDKTVFPPLNGLGILVENQSITNVRA